MKRSDRPGLKGTVCTVDRCSKERSIVEIRGERKRARQCWDHLAPKLRQFVINVPEGKSPDDPAICGAPLRGGGICQLASGWGTGTLGYGRCIRHGGAILGVVRGGERQLISEHQVVMGIPVDVSPAEAVLSCIRIAAGEVYYASTQIAGLDPEEAIVADKTTKRRPLSYGKDGEDTSVMVEETTETTRAREHTWITMRHDSMDRLVRYAKIAHDMGIAERQIALAEKVGHMMGSMIQAVLTQLELTPKQKKMAPEIVRRELMVVEGSAKELEGAGSR